MYLITKKGKTDKMASTVETLYYVIRLYYSLDCINFPAVIRLLLLLDYITMLIATRLYE